MKRYVLERCESVLEEWDTTVGATRDSPVPVFGADGAAGVLLADTMRLAEEVHSEVEFEWLRQWGSQGQGHAKTHRGYWAPRMQALEQTWRKLEARTAAHCKFLADAASCPDGLTARHALPEGVRCYDVLEQLLTKRQGKASTDKQEGRLGWAARVKSPAYKELTPQYRPFEFLQLPVDVDPSELLGLDLDADDEGDEMTPSRSPDTVKPELKMPSGGLKVEIVGLRAGRAAFQRRQATIPKAALAAVIAASKPAVAAVAVGGVPATAAAAAESVEAAAAVPAKLSKSQKRKNKKKKRKLNDGGGEAAAPAAAATVIATRGGDDPAVPVVRSGETEAEAAQRLKKKLKRERQKAQAHAQHEAAAAVTLAASRPSVSTTAAVDDAADDDDDDHVSDHDCVVVAVRTIVLIMIMTTTIMIMMIMTMMIMTTMIMMMMMATIKMATMIMMMMTVWIMTTIIMATMIMTTMIMATMIMTVWIMTVWIHAVRRWPSSRRSSPRWRGRSRSRRSVARHPAVSVMLRNGRNACRFYDDD